MTTFEEFMKKKKIDLAAMQQADGALFNEFRTHYAEMGEKSFDHTKKYWFNKLRRQYQLTPEAAPEKVRLENKLAEQTIINTITSPEFTNSPRKDEPDTSQQPKVGFKPKFRAANAPKQAEDTEQPKAEEAGTPTEEQPPKPKMGFTPKFRAANAPKPAEDTEQPKAEEADTTKEQPAKPKLGFTPKFRAANAPKPVEDTNQANETVENISSEEKSTAPKLGFKPKFRASNTQTPTEETETPAEYKAEATEAPSTETPSKPAYKPKFNMRNLPPKPPQE